MAQGRPRFWCDVLQAHVLRAQGPGPVITLTDDLSHSWLLAELPAFMEAASNHFRSCVHPAELGAEGAAVPVFLVVDFGGVAVAGEGQPAVDPCLQRVSHRRMR